MVVMTTQALANKYVVTCLYGLEAVLADEVRERLQAEAGTDWCEVGFTFDGSPARLKELRVAGNVFLEFDRFSIGHTKPDLDTLCGACRWTHGRSAGASCRSCPGTR
jgi:23S rRNA G2445 N2-methylase RlmL